MPIHPKGSKRFLERKLEIAPIVELCQHYPKYLVAHVLSTRFGTGYALLQLSIK